MTNEEEPVKMAGQEDKAVRMSGYLDKRGKMKLMSTWKRYWFVLKDQLLLYYKSQLECLNLSACRGSLNMGLASCVRPGAHRGPPATGTQGYTIEVVTRTQVVILRTKDRGLQEQWLKALLESMAFPNIATPVRTSGGPLHFRYSLDNLPVLEELEAEDKVKEKQKTLPYQTAVTRHDSVLGRIKRMGGHSYGGSLDTILKRRPSKQVPPHRSPQQPKIPRIRAVERMVGLQHEEQENADDREGQCLNNHENTAVLISKNHCTDLVNEQHCLNDSTYLVSKDEIWKPDGGDEIKCNDEVASCRPVVAASDSQELREPNFKFRNYESNQEAEVSVVAHDGNQNHEKCNVMNIEEVKKYTTNFLENQRYMSFLEHEEIFVENKLYEKVIEIEGEENTHEVENKLYEKTKEVEGKGNKHEIGNKLYEKTKHSEEDEEYDSEEELSGFLQVHRVPEDEKIYEVVSLGTDAVKQVQEGTVGLDDKEESDQYCRYDTVSLMQSLSDQRNSSSPEPDLPPRPSVGSNDLPKIQLKHQTTKDEDGDADYSVYYESTESYNNSTSPSQLLSSGTDGPLSDKKRSKLRVRIKLKKNKLSNKESVISEDGSNNSKKKRKMSFLRRMLKHYRTKPNYNSEALVTSDKHGSSDEPEYETVDYSAPTLKHNNVEEELPEPSADSNSTESLHKELHKEKLFGTKSLLTEQALVELKMKLKGRDDIIKSASAVPASGDIDGYECISSDEVPEWKPVPTPRSSKQMSSQDNKGIVVQASSHQCNTSINRANKPPSLPPRRVARPCSPWHDVPKNNSPIYGNFQDLGITVGEKIEDKIKKAHEPTTEKQSICQASEWDQEFQDAILGTPHGFVYIQKKWKAAEKSGELCHDQQGTKGKTLFPKSSQHRFPEKWSNVEEVQEKHMRSACDNSAESDTVSCEQRTVAVCVTDTFSSDIYSDVKKRHSSAKTIIKSFNLQTGKVTEKASDLSNTDKKVDNELTCIKGKTGEVNDSELKCNNSEVKVGSTKTEHHDTSGDRTHNYKNNNSKDCDINTTYHKDHPNDTIVTLRKSQSGLVSMCNKYEVLFNETENCGVVVNGENESFYSSQLHSETHTKGVKEETEDRAYAIKNNSVCSDCSNISTDYSAQGRIKTPFNTTCNQNILRSGTKDLCNRVVDDVEAAGYEDILPRLNRHSDELNLLLAQLAEITSAPLLPQGAATSLVDIPDGKKPKPQTDDSSQLGPTPPESSVLGPIRRRRHSDPDYDVPRPHGSLLHLLAPNRMSSHSSDHSQSRQENAIEATRFFGDVDLTSSSTYSSLSLRHSVISEVDDQSDTSYYVSMAPDSLEVPLNNDMEGSM